MAKAVVVLGARNLGGAIIDHFLGLGWSAAGVALSDDTLVRVRERGALPLAADAPDPAALQGALASARSELGSVDAIVNAVTASRPPRTGPFGGGPLSEADLAAFRGWTVAVAIGGCRKGPATPTCNHSGMCEDEPNYESFEERVRSIARELSRSAERMAQIDFDEVAESFGVDATRAREWVDAASGWLRAQTESVGEDMAARAARAEPGARSEPVSVDEDPLRSAAPHPLDLPTEEQGLALAALASGRWAVEPGSHTLVAHGEGAGPSHAPGLVRELHARDWIAADGELTLVGRHALSRWLEAGTAR